jgi:hypothetical protein
MAVHRAIADISQLPARGGTFRTARQLTHSKLCAVVRSSRPSAARRKRMGSAQNGQRGCGESRSMAQRGLMLINERLIEWIKIAGSCRKQLIALEVRTAFCRRFSSVLERNRNNGLAVCVLHNNLPLGIIDPTSSLFNFANESKGVSDRGIVAREERALHVIDCFVGSSYNEKIPPHQKSTACVPRTGFGRSASAPACNQRRR